MSDVLVNDVDRADALVDLSNVLRNTKLGGHGAADLVRLERVGAALTVIYGGAETAMFAAPAPRRAPRVRAARPGHGGPRAPAAGGPAQDHGGGQERDRFIVTQGRPTSVGRSSQGIDVSTFVDGPALDRVSRTHLRFDLDADYLTITDESTNGTGLILRDGSRLEFRRATRPFNLGDRAQICPGLEIIRSGRRYPAELAADRGRPHGPTDSPTRRV